MDVVLELSESYLGSHLNSGAPCPSRCCLLARHVLGEATMTEFSLGGVEAAKDCMWTRQGDRACQWAVSVSPSQDMLSKHEARCCGAMSASSGGH